MDVLFEIVVGTYEKHLLGYSLERTKRLLTNDDLFCLRPSFVTKSHIQSVRCLAANNKFLASGSTDETIQLFNMKTRQEVGALVHHNGTVTSLEFYDNYLMSSSEDKNICIWSTNKWQRIPMTLRGHKGAVNSISTHPSGKMALSVSKDKTLRTWNLVKGRSAYVTNIKKEAELVRWAPDGLHFVVIYNKDMYVYAIESGAVLHEINFNSKICDITFIKDHLCAVAGDDEVVKIYDIKTGSLSNEFKAHKSRVKTIHSVKVKEELFIVTASSDGLVKVWHLDTSEPSMKIRKVAEVKTGCRPTCMTLIAMQ